MLCPERGSRTELRRYPRVRVTRKVLVEAPGSRKRRPRAIALSPFGTQVSFDAHLGLGAEARLSLSTPDSYLGA